jgi:hypothetical protein
MSDFNREQLISDYIDRVIDNMSTKDMMRILEDQLEEKMFLKDYMSSYTDAQLIAEVQEYYPELLQD